MLTPDVARLRTVRELIRALAPAHATGLWAAGETIDALLASPPDGAAEREANGPDEEFCRCGAYMGPDREWCGRCEHSQSPTPAPGEAQAAGDALTHALRHRCGGCGGEGAFVRYRVSDDGSSVTDRVPCGFCAEREQKVRAALAARPTAVTEAIANRIADWVSMNLPFNEHGVVTVTRHDLKQVVRKATALAAGGAK